VALSFWFMSKDIKFAFWTNLLRALETDPRKVDFVRGVSGLEHPVIAAGVDDARRRLLLISGEHDARSAAIAQLDIQRVIESVQVVVMRPIAINLAPLAKQIVDFLGGPTVAPTQWQERLKALPDQSEMQSAVGQAFTRHAAGFDVATLNWVAQIMQIVQQLSMIDIETGDGADNSSSTGTLRFERLVNLDPAELDRHLGICPIPLYELSAPEAEAIQSGTDLDAIREVLRHQQILQFFFPSADHLALGLVDRGLQSPSSVLNELSKAPSIGHPFGPTELTPADLPIGETIDALQEKGYLVEGEIGIEMTSTAKSLRANIRFKPREGIVSKIANNVSIKLDLKDLFGLFEK
jgi:hypothetical protein